MGGDFVKARMESSELWKNCIGPISKLIEEAAFTFTPEGVKMKAMDPSHVALVDFELSAEGFDEYDVKGTRVLGMNLKEMSKFFSRAKKNDELVFGFQEGENRLDLTFKGTSTRKFTLPLLEIEEEELPEPELDFTASAKVLAGMVKDGLKDASLVTDKVRFELLEENFLMTTESDTGSTEMKLSEGGEGLQELEVDKTARAMYNIGYLNDIIKVASSKDIVEIHLGPDLPLRLNFSMAEGNGRLKFLVAPRIETE